jgi:PTS system nitrogen regulatory IIA component
MKISDVLRAENAVVDLAAASKSRLLQLLSEQAAKALGTDGRKILAALGNREKLGSTGIGYGVAIPHAPLGEIAMPFGLAARLARPIAFESIDEVPVDIVVLLLTPAHGRTAHLNVLAAISRRLRQPDVLTTARAAADAARFHRAIVGEDTAADAGSGLGEKSLVAGATGPRSLR